jgi:primosomal protein N' (replication factor Y) (superfamily II helicase)
MFAVVAVNAPVRSGGTAYHEAPGAGGGSTYPGPVFHYDIPAKFDAQVTPGALIEVPFGPRQVQALVIALSPAAPVPQTRPVTRRLYPEPVLSADQIELGLWLSARYFSPLIDCLRLMLPPGLLRRPQPVVRLHPEAPIPDDLSPTQQRVVEWLKTHGALSPARIARRLNRHSALDVIRPLVRRGILIRDSDLPAPRAHPKRANYVRLSASPPQVQAVRPLLGRPSKQAALLQALLDREDPLPESERLLELVDASPGILAAMSRKAWVDLEPERSLILATPGADDAPLARAPKQQAVLEYLRQQKAPVDEQALRQVTGASAVILGTLLARGLIQRITEPSVVILRLTEQEAQEQIVDLRHAARLHSVLDYLSAQPADEWLWVSWVYAETGCTLADLRILEEHNLVELAEREIWRDSLDGQSFVLERPPRLTPDQQRVWDAIQPHIVPQERPPSQPHAARGSHQAPPTFLLHGVTGSGKTEIYIRAAEATLQQGRQAIVLVPEISLTAQTVRRFAARFPEGLGVVHSKLSDGERFDTWRRIRSGQVRLVVGPRSALLAPLDDIGLIVLDEEHDSSYKQSDVMPAYHTRDVAAHIAGTYGATLLLGSATPDLVTYYRACETPAIRLLELPQRILEHQRRLEDQQTQHHLTRIRYTPISLGNQGLEDQGLEDQGPEHPDVYAIDLPPVRVIDMRHELRAGNRSIFSRLLQEEMKRCLANGEQVILFLNRRGASTFVMCRDCGATIRCPHCDIPLTYHLAPGVSGGEGTRLSCHHCAHQQAAPTVCPICQSRRIKHFGVGTQRVEQAVHELLPGARLLRWDRDTTGKQGSHDALLSRFSRHEADVLIGTQMIAKGLDLPLVTLVGVISADTALNLPDFRAAERTFQLLAQVAGRAGRGPAGGQAIIQTYTPEHYAIQAAAGHDYAAFYVRERAFRQQTGYPPFSRLARMVYTDADLARCRHQAQELGRALGEGIARLRLDALSLIGPAPCFLRRLRGRWRWQIIVRGSANTTDRHAIRLERQLDELLALVPLPPGWHLDIDPLDML